VNLNRVSCLWRVSEHRRSGWDIPMDGCYLRDVAVVFDIYMSVHRNIITNYSQQDANFLEFIYFYRRSTWYLHPSSGAHNCTYSFRYFQPNLLHAATVAIAAGSSISIVGVILWLYVQYGLYCRCNTVAVCTVWTVLWMYYCGCVYSMDCIVGVILWLYV
jgi:hypothetical protein